MPQSKILFGSAASWGLRKGRDHLPLTCNCSVSTVTAMGCREIPMQVCCGRFPAVTTFCRVLPTLQLLILCPQFTAMHSTSYWAAKRQLQCLSQGPLIWPLNGEQHIVIGKGVSPGKQLSQWQEISARQEKRELVQGLQCSCDFWTPGLCFMLPAWLGVSGLSIWITFVLSHQFVQAFRHVSGN